MTQDGGHPEEILVQLLSKRKKALNLVENKNREPHLAFPFGNIAFGIKIFSFKERCRMGSKTGWILRPSRRKKKEKEGIKIHVLD